jgi:hypothetical protein
VQAKRRRSKDFTPIFKGAELRPGAVVELRVTQGGAIGRVDRFVIRDAKSPTRVRRCLPPGVSKPRSCA